MASRQYDRQRPRPEPFDQKPQGFGNLDRAPINVAGIAKQERKGLVGRPPLQLEYTGYGRFVETICGKTVQGVRGDGYDSAAFQQFDGSLNLVLQGLTWPENGCYLRTRSLTVV